MPPIGGNPISWATAAAKPTIAIPYLLFRTQMIRHTSHVKEIALAIKNLVSKCTGLGEATITEPAETAGVGAGVASGVVTGLGDEGVAVDIEPTTFARPTVIVQTESLGCGPVYLSTAMYSLSDDRNA